MNHTPEEVLRFWFPPAAQSLDPALVRRQFEWWFRGGADAAIGARFAGLLERAAGGALDAWSGTARSRLALIIVLDQFPRSLHRGTAGAYACDAKARALTREGIACGHFAALATAWEKTFFAMPLGHSEDLADLERVVALTEELVHAGPQELRAILEFSAGQARGHHDVIARFGRHPHRNEVLGRRSTQEELDYLARGELVHTRSLPQAGNVR